MGYGIKIKVWGDFACFTRPEFKVERVSYDVITPSAARAILECIYWKPAIRWVVDKITVLSVPIFGNVKMNEVKQKAKCPKGDFSKLDGEKFVMYTTSEDDNRVQRGMMFLKRPSYVIDAHFELTGVGEDSQTDEDSKKHYNIILRRAREGQFFKQPYFGLRDFSANVKLLEDETPASPLKGEVDLGFMLYDLKFKKDKNGKCLNDAEPIFYRPKMIDGVIDVATCYKNSAIGGEE
jgi:CRISPR-associated protein Cas5d